MVLHLVVKTTIINLVLFHIIAINLQIQQREECQCLKEFFAWGSLEMKLPAYYPP